MPAATEQDVRDCYRLLLGREADPVGLAVYARAVRAGLPREKLVLEFIRSEEFRNLSGLNRPAVEFSEKGFTFIDRPPGPTKYDRLVAGEIKRRVPSGAVVVDVGSGTGFFPLTASTAAGLDGIVVAIEPDPDRVGLLARNVQQNDRGNIMILPCAASTDLRPFRLDGSEAAEAPVPSIELDKALRPPLDRLDLVRIGVGGLEFCALAAFESTLRRFRPTLVTHFDPKAIASRLTEAAVDDYLAWLFDHFGTLLLLKPNGATAALGSPSDAQSQVDAEFAMAGESTHALTLIGSHSR
jgi:FkbM family methyltransferase